jgi:hypothetical protein
MNFSYDRVWADVMMMSRTNWLVLLTVAGVFMFLPAFALWLFAPLPDSRETGAAAMQVIITYYQKNLGAFLLVNLVSSFGQLVIFVLLLDSERPTVGEAIRRSVHVFPGFFAAMLIANLALVAGFALLIVPGLYLLGRLTVLGPTIADRHLANPVAALQLTVRQTSGLGWRIVGLVMLVGLVAWIVTSAATSVVTVVVALLLPSSLDAMAAALADALGGAALSLLLAVLSAAIYRQIAPRTGI